MDLLTQKKETTNNKNKIRDNQPCHSSRISTISQGIKLMGGGGLVNETRSFRSTFATFRGDPSMTTIVHIIIVSSPTLTSPPSM